MQYGVYIAPCMYGGVYTVYTRMMYLSDHSPLPPTRRRAEIVYFLAARACVLYAQCELQHATAVFAVFLFEVSLGQQHYRQGPALGGPLCDDFYITRELRPRQSFLSAQLGLCIVTCIRSFINNGQRQLCDEYSPTLTLKSTTHHSRRNPDWQSCCEASMRRAGAAVRLRSIEACPAVRRTCHLSCLACRSSRTSISGRFRLLSQAEQSFGKALDGARQTSMVNALLEARGDESTW